MMFVIHTISYIELFVIALVVVYTWDNMGFMGA